MRSDPLCLFPSPHFLDLWRQTGLPPIPANLATRRVLRHLRLLHVVVRTSEHHRRPYDGYAPPATPHSGPPPPGFFAPPPPPQSSAGSDPYGPAPGSIDGDARNDDEHERIVQERRRRERPCRTLFVRNVKVCSNVLPSRPLFGLGSESLLDCAFRVEQFGVTPEDVRQRFEAIGDIKTFFDVLEKRGMVFITFVSVQQRLQAGSIR